jgi:hypothetical protein
LNSPKTAVINGDDLAAALVDRTTAALIADACAYGDSLAASGKDHSLSASDR